MLPELSITADTSSGIIIVTSLLFLAVAIFLIFISMKNALEDHRKLQDRLKDMVKAPDEGILPKSKALASLGNHISLPNEGEITKIRFELSQAGYYSTASVKTYYAARLLCLIIPQFIMLFSWGWISTKISVEKTIFLACFVTVLGLFAPTLFVRFKKNARTDQIRRGFPDMMDLLVASIEAGLSMNAALVRVSEEIQFRYPALKDNLDILNLELRAGRERHIGMMNFAHRVNLEEAKALAVMLKQAEEMGASLGAALRTFASDMRHKRMMKAEEKAMALSAKLTVPLILFIFPSIMAMLLIPAGIRLTRGLAG